MPEFRTTGPDLETIREQTARRDVIDSMRTLVKLYDEEVSLIRGAVRSKVEEYTQTKGAYMWESAIEEEEAMLLASAEDTTTQKMLALMDYYRWNFERYSIPEVEEDETAWTLDGKAS